MRCLFTMFAEDVELLPKNSFPATFCKNASPNPDLFPLLMSANSGRLWTPAAFPRAGARREKIQRLFVQEPHEPCKLPTRGIAELFEAAKADWRTGRAAIFGTLLEQALDPAERRQAGRPLYAARLCRAACRRHRVEPLKLAIGANVQAAAEDQARGRRHEGRASDRSTPFTTSFAPCAFSTRPAAPETFLYVSLELMKRLEGEVLEAQAPSLAEQGACRAMRPDHRPASIFGA